jgi:hypothetical protein
MLSTGQHVKQCLRCGVCCLTEKCQASIIATGGTSEICQFLRLEGDGFYFCGLVEYESSLGFQPLISNALGIGLGCPNA